MIKIEHDPLFIAQRLREVDKSYYIVYNTDFQRYEVHSSEQKGGSFCFIVKDNTLDARTIDYALKSRSENVEKLIRALDEENERNRLRLARSALEKIEEDLC